MLNIPSGEKLLRVSKKAVKVQVFLVKMFKVDPQFLDQWNFHVALTYGQ